MSFEIIMLILSLHFAGDFILQSDWMAQGKSSRYGVNYSMFSHIFVYSLCLTPLGFAYAGVNAITHWITDTISSKATSYLWKRNERHWFFVVIGLDQLAHYAVLFYSYGKI